jgi:hypothetical protein
MRFVQVSLLLAIGCNQTTVPDPDTTTVPDDTVVNTGFPPGDLANIHIRHNVNNETTSVFAVFAESAPNFLNLAKCGIEESTCIPAMPGDEDSPFVFDPDDSLDQETIRTRFVGDVVGIGPYAMPYAESGETKFGFYTLDATELGFVEGPMGASWAGQWPVYASTDDLVVSAPIQIISPREGGKINMTNAQLVPFEWVPTGQGEVTLTLIPEVGDAIIYRLDDDGYYELNTDDLTLELGLTDAITEFTGFLSRWDRSTVIRFGHVIEYVASSDVEFNVSLVNIGTRLRLNPADECAEAQGSVGITEGSYWGYMGLPRLDGDMDTDGACLDPAFTTPYDDSAGPDGVYRVEIEPRHAFSFDYNLISASASVYLVEDCNDVVGSCVDGSDLEADPDIHEFVSYFNDDDETQTLYLVLDSSDFGAESFFTLDVTDEFLDEPDMYDSCQLASLASPTVGAGTWWGTFLAFTAGTNPGAGGCTGTELAGADAMTPVEVPAGATLTAQLNMAGSDAGLYLLFDCNDAFSCADGSDKSQNGPESVTYTNSTQFPITVYLVVDSKTGITPYFLTIAF